MTGGVRAVLERRVSQVPGAWRGLLELAAVLGRQLEPQVLLCSDAAAGLRGRPLDDFLQGCAELSILEVRDQRWRFVHDKLREYVLEGLRAPGAGAAGTPAGRREQELHRAALTAIERAHAARGPEPEAARDQHRLQLAHHYLEAVPLLPAARALAVALQAAEHALQQLGFAEAATLLERALVVSERAEAAELDERCRYALLLLLGQAQIRAGNPGRGQEVCERAAGLARRLGEPELLAQAAVVYGSEITLGYTDPKLVQLLEEALAVLPPRDHPLRARALGRLAAALQPAPDPQEPVELGLQAVAMARRLGDTEVLRATLTASCSAFVNHLPAPQRRDFNHEVVQLATAARDRVQVLRGHMRLVFDHAELGELDGVEENIRALEGFAHEFRQEQYQWPPRMMRAMTALIAGRFDESDAISREVLALGERHREGNALLSAGTHRMCRLHCGELHDELRAHEQTLRRMVSRVFARHSYLQWVVTAWCQARAGRLDEVQDSLARVRGSRELLNNRIFMPYAAEPCLVVGDVEFAARLHTRLEREEPGRFWQFGLASMAIYPPYAQQLGLTALTLGRTDEAVFHLFGALQRSERTGLVAHLARLRYKLAGALQRRGRPGDRRRARGLLRQARELALALGQRDLVPLVDVALVDVGRR
ncbi:MAG: hypothetical protein U1A78_40520 [Polyangia bacterium]